jgi:hypothetical protein
MTDEHDVVAKVGRVTGRVGPGTIGEVMLPVRGGAEAFYAYAHENGTVIEAGTRVVVVEFEAPRTVRVSPL